MKSEMERRDFIRSGGLIIGGVFATSLATRKAEAAQSNGRTRKALGWGMLQEKTLSLEDRLKVIKDSGFEGIEVSRAASKKAETDPRELAAAAQKVGVVIHGVSNGGNGDLDAAIEEAAIYGATTVLHVVRADANVSYLENYKRSQDLIRAAIPKAEQKKIKICVENVWATFLIEPMGMARYLDEIGSPWVRSYFDIGNVMRWGWPQQWIEVLGKRIEKIHIKEFSLKTAMKEGMSKAFDFPIGQGDIDWKRVREELAKIEFHDWATAEVRGGDRKRIAEISSEMDRVLFS